MLTDETRGSIASNGGVLLVGILRVAAEDSGSRAWDSKHKGHEGSPRCAEGRGQGRWAGAKRVEGKRRSGTPGTIEQLFYFVKYWMKWIREPGKRVQRRAAGTLDEDQDGQVNQLIKSPLAPGLCSICGVTTSF